MIRDGGGGAAKPHSFTTERSPFRAQRPFIPGVALRCRDEADTDKQTKLQYSDGIHLFIDINIKPLPSGTAVTRLGLGF